MTSKIISADGREKVGSTSFMGCSAYHSTTQSITNATETAVTLDSENFDTSSIHSTSSNTSRFTVPSGGAGYWVGVVQIQWDTTTTNSRWLQWYKNGAAIPATYVKGSAVSNGKMQAVLPPVFLNDGDYLEAYVYQDSGGTRTIGVAGTDGNSVTIWKTDGVIGPQGLSVVSGGLVFNGRLTLSSGNPTPLEDQTGKTTIYFTPYKGRYLSLFDGTNWNTRAFNEFSVAIGTVTSGLPYDLFIYDNAGVPTFRSPVAWRQAGVAITGATNATPIVITANSHGLSNGDEAYISQVLGNTAANGTWTVANVTTNTFELQSSVGNGTYTSATGWAAARVTKLVLQDGVYVKSGATTDLYVGTFTPTSTTATESSEAKRHLWNMFNRVPIRNYKTDSTQHNVTSATWNKWNANASGHSTEFTTGVAGASDAQITIVENASGNSTALPYVGLALDSTTVANIFLAGQIYQNGGFSALNGGYAGFHMPPIYPGKHTVYVMEANGTGTGTSIYYYYYLQTRLKY